MEQSIDQSINQSIDSINRRNHRGLPNTAHDRYAQSVLQSATGTDTSTAKSDSASSHAC